MKTKSFQKYIETRLSKEKITEIEKEAALEIKILQTIQQAIANALAEYMQHNNMGFNALVRHLDSSPAHVAKIQRCEANLTVSSIAHILALVGKEPRDIFKTKKNK